ncbi:hypothetical protein ILYODFUR_022036, partial [Ilyodon furcidens]
MCRASPEVHCVCVGMTIKFKVAVSNSQQLLQPFLYEILVLGLQTYASRSSHEQARVRALWRQATSLRGTFTQLKTFTDRALSDMRGECVAVCQLLHVACKKLEARAPEKSPGCGSEMLAHEIQLKNKLKETMQLQVRWDAEKVELNC